MPELCPAPATPGKVTTMAEHTTVKLAKALGEIPGVPREMIRKAFEGYYHDYLSPLDLPEIQLVLDLTELARLPATPAASRPLLRQMAERVKSGDFDATREESEEWVRSPEGQETMRQLADDVTFNGIVRDIRKGTGSK